MPNLLLKVPSLNETSRTPFAWANDGIVVYTMYYAIPCASYGKIYSTTHTRKKLNILAVVWKLVLVGGVTSTDSVPPANV